MANLHVKVTDGSKTMTFIIPASPKLNDIENIDRARDYFGLLYDVISVELVGEYRVAPPHKCPYCGAPSFVDPSDASPPPDYCHEEDHGYV